MSSREKDYTKFPYKLTKYERKPTQNYLNFVASFREPAGKNLPGKVISLTYAGSLGGVILGVLESAYKQSPNAFFVAGNVAKGVVTLGGAMFFYAAGTHLSGAILNLKEDHPNHIIGGFMGAIPIAARLKNPYAGIMYGAVFAFASLCGRYGAREGQFEGFIPNQVPLSREYSWRVNHFKYPMFNRPHEEGEHFED